MVPLILPRELDVWELATPPSTRIVYINIETQAQIDNLQKLLAPCKTWPASVEAILLVVAPELLPGSGKSLVNRMAIGAAIAANKPSFWVHFFWNKRVTV